MDQKHIKFAVVGLGRIGKRHIDIINVHPMASLVACCDLLALNELNFDPEVPLYDTMEALFEAHDPDVVCICTPNGLHVEHATLALEGNAHVVCEKPLGLNKSSCESLIYTALKHNKRIFCVMQNRYSPPSKWIKELLDKQVLGRIYMVQINCYWNRDDRYYFDKKGIRHPWKGTLSMDGGPLFTQFSHFVDIMYWLFGDIVNIKAIFNNFSHQHSTEFEDSGIISFDFVNGGMGCFNYSTAVFQQNLESSLTIIAEKGSVKIGGQYMDKVEYCHIDNYTMPALDPVNPPNDYDGVKGSASNHLNMIENVIEVLLLSNTITTNAMEGMKVVEIIEKIYQLK